MLINENTICLFLNKLFTAIIVNGIIIIEIFNEKEDNCIHLRTPTLFSCKKVNSSNKIEMKTIDL